MAHGLPHRVGSLWVAILYLISESRIPVQLLLVHEASDMKAEKFTERFDSMETGNCQRSARVFLFFIDLWSCLYVINI